MILGDGNGIADMVAMTVGQRNMGDALGRFLEVDAFCTGISVQERIDEDDGLCSFNTEGGVAEPGQFHEDSPSISISGLRTDMTPIKLKAI